MLVARIAFSLLALLAAFVPACGSGPRAKAGRADGRGDAGNVAGNVKKGGAGKGGGAQDAGDGGGKQDAAPGNVASDDGVVFFPAGALDAIQAKRGKFAPVRARLDDAIAHARNSLAQRPDASEGIKLEGVSRANRDTGRILGEFDLVLDFALAYRLTAEAAFLEKADEFLRAWAKTYRADGNPINEYHFVTLIMAYELVRDRLPAKTREQFGRMLLAMYEAEHDFVTRGKGFEIHGNWVSHHVTLCAAIAFLRKDAEQIAYVEGVFKSQLSNNILDRCRFHDFAVAHWAKRTKDIEEAPNDWVERGTTFDFVHRDALSYHLESLSALFVAAVIAKNNGRPWFELTGEQGQTLWWGYDFVIPYATGEKRHYEFDKTLHPADREKKEKRWFKPEDGQSALAFASTIHAEYRKFWKPELVRNDEGFLIRLVQTGADQY